MNKSTLGTKQAKSMPCWRGWEKKTWMTETGHAGERWDKVRLERWAGPGSCWVGGQDGKLNFILKPLEVLSTEWCDPICICKTSDAQPVQREWAGSIHTSQKKPEVVISAAGRWLRRCRKRMHVRQPLEFRRNILAKIHKYQLNYPLHPSMKGKLREGSSLRREKKVEKIRWLSIWSEETAEGRMRRRSEGSGHACIPLSHHVGHSVSFPCIFLWYKIICLSGLLKRSN